MKALYFDGKEARLRADYPKPEPQPGESLVRVLLAAICNTDKEIMRGYKPGFTGVMGHEFVGVAEYSPGSDFEGRLVVGELNAGCGECIYCKTGRAGHCENRRVLGMVDKDGCFAEYMTIRTELLHAVPEGLSAEGALFTEPLAAALRIQEQSHIPPSARVAVLGDGRLAYMIAQVLSLSGACVVVIGRHPEKLAAFEGFAETLCGPSGSYEVVVDATGSPSGFKTAMGLVRSGGLLILKSTYAGGTDAALSEIVVREITVRGSRCGPFEPALKLLSRGLVKMPPVSFYPLEEYERAFASEGFKAGFRIGAQEGSV